MIPDNDPRQTSAGRILLACACLALWGAALGKAPLGTLLALALLPACALRFAWDARKAAKFGTRAGIAALAAFAFVYWSGKAKADQNAAMEMLMYAPAFLYARLFVWAYSKSAPSPEPRKGDDGAAVAQKSFDARYPFAKTLSEPRNPDSLDLCAVSCFFAAFVSMPPSKSMLYGLFALFVLLLGPFGKTGRHKPLPMAMSLVFLAACAGGYAGGNAFNAAHSALEDQLFEWAKKHLDINKLNAWNANKSETSIGKTGKNELANKLLWRLTWDQGSGLIRRNALSVTPNGVSWSMPSSADGKNPAEIQKAVDPDGALYIGSKGKENEAKPSIAKLYSPSAADKTVLPLPAGIHAIYGLPEKTASVNPFGAVTANGNDSALRLGLLFYPAQDDKLGEPLPEDLAVPEFLSGPLQRFLDEHRIEPGRPGGPAALAEAIRSAFASEYQYTLELASSDGSPRTLSKFLTKDKRGHCEYFASSSALLLRKLGVPARYATGFLAEEFHESEKTYWLRQKHSHAWTLYWNGSGWATLDSTVSGQGSREENSFFAAASDWLDEMQYMLDNADFSGLARFAFGPGALRAAFAAAGLAICAAAAAFALRAARRGIDEKLAINIRELETALVSAGMPPRKAGQSSCDYWRRCAGRCKERKAALFDELACELERIAALREKALFGPRTPGNDLWRIREPAKAARIAGRIRRISLLRKAGISCLPKMR